VKAEIYDEVKRGRLVIVGEGRWRWPGGLERQGQVTPALDRTYPLPETQAAIDYVGGGHAHGEVVITI
jgi:hypothetical protein